MKMSAMRSKNSGWAAVTLKQHPILGIEAESGNDPYPPISSTVTPLHSRPDIIKNNDLQGKSFSSVLHPSVNFPTLGASKDIKKPLPRGTSSSNQRNKVIEGKRTENVYQAYEKLRELHPWADKILVEHIMEAVSNDTGKASDLLKAMVSPEDNLEEVNKNNISASESYYENFHLENNASLDDTDLSIVESKDEGLNCAAEDNFMFKNKEPIHDHAPSGKRHEQILGNLMYVPVEPEWEEDDIYRIHRKDAVRMLRSASRHSKVANDAYLRGNHLSAQQFSRKAREEWKAAEELNAMAAKEILRIRNCKNDVWKLDLHGLHASEAVRALRDHLHKIEWQIPFVPPSPASLTAGMVRSVSAESFSMDTEMLDKQLASYRPRPTLLEVITGKGNHSHGQPALPRTIETFLSENGYHYDENRPGVIRVRPKLRTR